MYAIIFIPLLPCLTTVTIVSTVINNNTISVKGHLKHKMMSKHW